jgi:hypothetical protein
MDGRGAQGEEARRNHESGDRQEREASVSQVGREFQSEAPGTGRVEDVYDGETEPAGERHAMTRKQKKLDSIDEYSNSRFGTARGAIRHQLADVRSDPGRR